MKDTELTLKAKIPGSPSRKKNGAAGKLLIFFLCLLPLLLAAPIQGRLLPQSSQREVAVTFDDLPLQGPPLEVDKLRDMTRRLLQSITSRKIPAFGDVNESKLYRNNQLDPARVAVLRMWLDAGLELGNHTFSHADLNTTPLAAYREDVIRGETVTSSLLRERGMKLRYFRHPVLHAGRNAETKKALEEFLTGRGYIIAPVTIDNQDFMFAEVYARAKHRGDKETMNRVAQAYVPYLEKMFDFFEKLSLEVLGYEVKQVLLLHANELNADYFDQLISMMERRGYKFISLEHALADKAYNLPDAPTPKGLSWLHRWALAQGKELKPEPREPEWITKLFEARAGRSK